MEHNQKWLGPALCNPLRRNKQSLRVPFINTSEPVDPIIRARLLKYQTMGIYCLQGYPENTSGLRYLSA
jgi:hypothetical protein